MKYKLSVTKAGQPLTDEEIHDLITIHNLDPDKIYDSPFGDATDDIQSIVELDYHVVFGPIQPIRMFGLDFYPPQNAVRKEVDLSEGDMVADDGDELYVLTCSSEGNQTIYRYYPQVCAGSEIVRIRETYELIDVQDA